MQMASEAQQHYSTPGFKDMVGATLPGAGMGWRRTHVRLGEAKAWERGRGTQGWKSSLPSSPARRGPNQRFIPSDLVFPPTKGGQ